MQCVYTLVAFYIVNKLQENNNSSKPSKAHSHKSWSGNSSENNYYKENTEIQRAILYKTNQAHPTLHYHTEYSLNAAYSLNAN